MAYRRYRDPLHDIISLDESNPEDSLLINLIDSPEFQRLRRIKQLGLAMYTYQGAEHTRFTHSLGVMHLMTRVLNLLAGETGISEEARLVARTGALLHDIGHGPFSHIIEGVFGIMHEDWTRRIILDESTHIHGLLSSYDSSLPRSLDSLINHAYKPGYVSQLVSSQLDCDRMDYLLRDSLMTGAKYGIYDLEWVLHALKIDEASDRVYVEAKGLYAIEEYLQARYYMFRQVYFHRTLRSAEAVLVSALKRSRELLSEGRLGFIIPGSVFEKFLRGQELTPAEYMQLDDYDLVFHLKQWSRDSDPVLADLAGRFTGRNLFKAIDLDLPSYQVEEFWAKAREIVTRAGFDISYYLIRDRASDIPYYGYYAPEESDPKGLIYVETGWPNSTIREISEVSDVVRGMRGYRIDRACFPAEVIESISSLLSSLMAT